MNGPVIRRKPVYLPEPVWGRLASVADDRGITVEELLVAAVASVTAPKTLEQQIAQLVRAGYPDADIASMTGVLLQRVAGVRRAAHLPANRLIRGASRNDERKTA